MAGAIADHISSAQSYVIPFAGYVIMGMYAMYVFVLSDRSRHDLILFSRSDGDWYALYFIVMNCSEKFNRLGSRTSWTPEIKA